MKLQMQESQTIEFKQIWKDDYIKWISAFANTDGGKLYIGVADDTSIVGVANAKKLLVEIPNKARDILGVEIDVNLLVEDSKEYLEIITPRYPNAISYEGGYYHRVESSTLELKGAELDTFLLSRAIVE
ncbi:hypothetical protein GJV85_00535 [Sulfurimonas aquatica]|uniref:Schlafen AlbA-2 domain-containing protein n=1 Tax=Sulfurimonas aquatica TaxID=2672570 RepID=A0A975AXZ7_9BACT|nr:ATP-binding protein [Sulfurimonas aquatica]QSZ40666.1 hypothetical protein GJV85_00535 [Sulfurimonas aquatica]